MRHRSGGGPVPVARSSRRFLTSKQKSVLQEARSTRQPASAAATASQAERKVSSGSSMASPSSGPRGPFSFADSVSAQTRQKKAPAVLKPAPGSREAPLGREEHVRALTSFLAQTRKLGVPDEQALKLLDKELAKGECRTLGPC